MKPHATVALSVVPTLLLLAIRFGEPVMPMDEGIPVLYADLVGRGFVPHRDFQTLYGPGTPWLVAAAYAAFGTSIDTERLVGIAVRLALVAGATTFAGLWGARPALATGLLSAMLIMPLGLHAAAAIAAVACCLWSVLALMRSISWRWAALAGALAGAAMVFRPDYVAAAIAPAAVLMWGTDPRRVFAYALGMIAGVAPLAAHAIIATPAALIDNLVTDALRAVPSRRLPLPPAEAGDALLLLVIVLLVPWALWHASRGLRGSTSPPARGLLAYGILTALLVPQATQRADSVHIALVAVPAAALLVLSCSRLSAVIPARVPLRTAALLSTALFYAVFAVGLALAPEPTARVSRLDRSYPDAPFYARQLRSLVARSEAYLRPGMRLFVGPADLTRAYYNDTILYFLFPDLVPATYYLEMEPMTANREGSRLAADVASADVLVLTTRWDAHAEPNDSRIRGSDAPVRVVAERFRLVAREGDYALYVRR